MQTRYIRPNSLSWWAGAAAIVAGGVQALAEGYEPARPAAAVIASVTGGIAPAVLINIGLGFIGIRDAIERMRQGK